MDNQNYIYYLPFIAILVIWIFFLKRLRQYGKARAAKANKIEQYERRTTYSYAIVFILAGLILQMTTLINWSSISPGNEPIAAAGIVIGLAFVVFGFYKFYRYHSK